MAEQYSKEQKRKTWARLFFIGALSAYSLQPQIKPTFEWAQELVDGWQPPAANDANTENLTPSIDVCRGYVAVTVDPRGFVLTTTDPVRASQSEVVQFHRSVTGESIRVDRWYSLRLGKSVTAAEVICHEARLLDSHGGMAISNNIVTPACDTSAVNLDALEWRRQGVVSVVHGMAEEAADGWLRLLSEQEARNACQAGDLLSYPR